jgi:sugar/nucleoside kinase (ribokinase family)
MFYMHVLVIGSSLFDVIISLENNPHVIVEGTKASFSLGDKVPIDIKGFTIGGNATNVAASLRKLSIESSFYTYLGQDPLSSYIKGKLTEEGITLYCDTTGAQNGPLSLIFDFLADRTIFSYHPEFEHGFDEVKVIEKPTHIYLTSIGKIWESAYEKILDYASKENISIAFSPGSQQMKNMNDVFIRTVHQAKMLFCNKEEAALINQKLTDNTLDNSKDLLLSLKNNGFELISMTDGANGAYVIDKDGKVYKTSAVKPEGHEKTGAGDAYAGAFLASYLKGKDIFECMKRGSLNSAGVMSKVGAHTGQLTAEEMEEKANQTQVESLML